MKIFFRIFLIFLGIIIIIPATIIVLLMDSSKPPVAVYRDNEDFEIMEVLGGSLDYMLENAETNDLEFGLTQDELNTFIFQQLRNMNEDYLIDDDPENAYVLKEEMFGVVGGWSTLAKDKITIKLRADLLQPIKFKTSVSLTFKFNLNSPGNSRLMTLQLDSAKVGKLKLPRNIVNKIAETVGLDLKEQVENFLTMDGVKVGEFKVDTWTIEVDKIKLAETLLGGNPDSAVFVTLIKVLTVNELIDIEFSKDKVAAKFVSTKLYLDEDSSGLHEDVILNDEDEKNLMLANKKVDMLLSGMVSEEDTLSVNLTELDMNRILDYYFYGLANLDQDIELGGDTFELQVSSPWVIIEEGVIKFNIRIQLSNANNPAQKFVTVLVIDIDAAQIGTDIGFELGALSIGKDVTLSAADTRGILDMLSATDFVTENMMMINEFLTKFSTEHMTADGLSIKDGYILLPYRGNTADALEAISDVKTHIRDALAVVMVTYPQLATEYNALISKANPTVDDLQEFLDALYLELGDDGMEIFGDELVNALLVAKIGSIIQQLPPGFPSVIPSGLPSYIPSFVPTV